MIFDTDVLIWCFQGNKRAAAVIDATKEREISVVNYMEILQGARDKKELHMIRSFLKDLGFKMLPLGENIGARACVYIEEYALKSGLKMADALLAATAVESQSTLCSGNARHYKVISELDLKTFRS